MHDFTVTVDQQPDLAVITMAGEMDLVTVPAVEKAALLVPPGAKTLHLEMSGVSFMDSSGLNLLLRLRRRMHTEAGRLVLSGLQEQPAGVLRLTETYELLTKAESIGAILPAQRQTPSRV
ncbi:STAS domain-containing protein [Streptomyces flavidovirens]|uniref:Anti-sigma factor antagonist n=1 Tax=Streptomyces flavidovirens TaxID=67298 RepID=A0ABW6RIN7_9ACTN